MRSLASSGREEDKLEDQEQMVNLKKIEEMVEGEELEQSSLSSCNSEGLD